MIQLRRYAAREPGVLVWPRRCLRRSPSSLHGRHGIRMDQAVQSKQQAISMGSAQCLPWSPSTLQQGTGPMQLLQSSGSHPPWVRGSPMHARQLQQPVQGRVEVGHARWALVQAPQQQVRHMYSVQLGPGHDCRTFMGWLQVPAGHRTAHALQPRQCHVVRPLAPAVMNCPTGAGLP